MGFVGGALRWSSATGATPKHSTGRSLDRASHLVCLTDSDDTNAEVTLQATELVVSRRGSALNCLVQIRDPSPQRADEIRGARFATSARSAP